VPVPGVRSVTHFFPFQRSASTRWLFVSPTAMHGPRYRQETASRMLCRPDGSAIHFLPLQALTSGQPALKA
jgi:hypothetical protein